MNSLPIRLCRLRCVYLISCFVITLTILNGLTWLNIIDKDRVRIHSYPYPRDQGQEAGASSILNYLFRRKARVKSVAYRKSISFMSPKGDKGRQAKFQGNGRGMNMVQLIQHISITPSSSSKDTSEVTKEKHSVKDKPVDRPNVTEPLMLSQIEETNTPRHSFLFKNVQILGGEGMLRFFDPFPNPNPPFLPSSIPFLHERNEGWAGIRIVNYTKPKRSLKSDPEKETCTRWVNKTAVLFNTRYPSNIFHFLHDGAMALFSTLGDTLSLEPVGESHSPFKCGSASGIRITNNDDIMLISANAKLFNISPSLVSPWLIEKIGLEQVAMEQVDGWCFKSIIVGLSNELGISHGHFIFAYP